MVEAALQMKGPLHALHEGKKSQRVKWTEKGKHSLNTYGFQHKRVTHRMFPVSLCLWGNNGKSLCRRKTK